MAGFFKKRSDDTTPGNSNPKQKQQVLLLLLLLLLGAFAYLYYFTGLIKPREHAPSPPVRNEQVKQPIPQRAAQPGEPSKAADVSKGTAPVAGDKSAVTATAPAAGTTKPDSARPGPSSAPAPAAATAAPKPAVDGKTVAKPVAPKAAPKPETAKGAVKPESQSAVKPDAVKPSPGKVKAIAAESPAAAPAGKSGVDDNKNAAGARVAGTGRTDAGKSVAKKKEKYSVVVKGVPGSEEALSLRGDLTKAGIRSVKVNNVQRPEQMNRLFIGEFAERGQAEVELQKIRKLNADAFILKNGSNFGVYAGSYLSENRASKEKAQLESKGIKIALKKTKVTIPVVELTAGPFGTRSAAEKEAARLGKKGYSVKIVKAGK